MTKKYFKRNYKIFLTIILAFIVILVSYSNCSDINLKAKNQPSKLEVPLVVPTPTPSPSPSPSPTPPPPDDPLTGIISPLPPVTQYPPLSNPADSCAVTPDLGNYRAALNFYQLTTPQVSGCPASFKIVKSYTTSNGATDTGACNPTTTTELSEPSVVNLPPGDPYNIIFHDIRFLRPNEAAVYSFRIRTPSDPMSMSLFFYSLYSTRLEYPMLGCNGSQDCGPLDSYVSVTKDPCDFTFQNSTCRFQTASRTYFQVRNAPVNLNNCELQTNSVYYININFVKPKMGNLGSFDGNTSRIGLEIRAP